ncbi:MAG TPA: VWA domain-containing protein [Vicinamibacterales bacterium]|nr:VWA domain-containing protein [Vicinamibacterales bacterium]
MRRLALALGLALLGAAAPRAQQTPFKSSVDLVPVFATVLEKNGAFRNGLTKDDFIVLDNGKPQTITSFSSETEAISVALILDTSGSMVEAERRVTRAAGIFLDELGKDDRATVGTLWFQGPSFTSDKERLWDSLNMLPRDGSSPVYAAINRALTALQKESNRRVIVMYTDGKNNAFIGRALNSPKGPVPADSSQLLANLRTRVERDGVMIYAIGFEGVPLARDMKSIALRSGGRATELKKNGDLAKELAAVVDELHHQYLLGFAPQTMDGLVHKLEVRVKPKGLTVRARQSYIASGSESK